MLRFSLALMNRLNKTESAIFTYLFWFGCSWGGGFYLIYYLSKGSGWPGSILVAKPNTSGSNRKIALQLFELFALKLFKSQ